MDRQRQGIVIRAWLLENAAFQVRHDIRNSETQEGSCRYDTDNNLVCPYGLERFRRLDCKLILFMDWLSNFQIFGSAWPFAALKTMRWINNWLNVNSTFQQMFVLPSHWHVTSNGGHLSTVIRASSVRKKRRAISFKPSRSVLWKAILLQILGHSCVNVFANLG